MSKDKIISLPEEKAFIAYRFDTRSFKEIDDSGGFIDRFDIDEHIFINDKYIDAGYLYEGEAVISEKFTHILSNNLPSNAGAHLGGISVCLNPLGRMFNMQKDEVIYLHVISIEDKVIPVSPLYQTQDDYQRLINYVYHEQIEEDTIISSFDQLGNEILSLKIDIGSREKIEINIVIEREEDQVIARKFKVRTSEKKPVLHNQNGRIIGFLEEGGRFSKNIIDYFGNKIGDYWEEKNLVLLSDRNIFLKNCQLREMRVYKNNVFNFDDNSFEEIIKNSHISEKSQKYLVENYDCQKLTKLINKSKIISKNNIYEFEDKNSEW